MMSSTLASKRSRPLFGTFLTIEVDQPELITELFTEASRLEAKFSIYNPDSEISRLNAGASELTLEFANLLKLAREISQASNGAFYLPAFELDGLQLKGLKEKFDLNGIAKGAIVDALAEWILERAPNASGSINAGGDLRRFGNSQSQIQLRLGSYDQPVIRYIELGAEAIATSSLTVANSDPNSRTNYSLPLRKGLTGDSSATVIAAKCAVADALTKVALFAEPEIIAKCAEKFAARILIFDSEGQITETYSPR